MLDLKPFAQRLKSEIERAFISGNDTLYALFEDAVYCRRLVPALCYFGVVSALYWNIVLIASDTVCLKLIGGLCAAVIGYELLVRMLTWIFYGGVTTAICRSWNGWFGQSLGDSCVRVTLYFATGKVILDLLKLPVRWFINFAVKRQFQGLIVINSLICASLILCGLHRLAFYQSLISGYAALLVPIVVYHDILQKCSGFFSQKLQNAQVAGLRCVESVRSGLYAVRSGLAAVKAAILWAILCCFDSPVDGLLIVGAADRVASAKTLVATEEKRGDMIPKHWICGKDAVGYRRVHVLSTSSEYQDVVKTLGTNRFQILNVQRIENVRLYSQYLLQKAHVESCCPSSHIVERHLFHGTSSQNVDFICAIAFDRSLAGSKNGCAYGIGSYFARDFSCSAQYARASDPNAADGFVFLCKVLTGEFVRGDGNMKALPLKPNRLTVRYDSAVDNVADPKVFVVFADCSAYPAYLIQFRH